MADDALRGRLDDIAFLRDQGRITCTEEIALLAAELAGQETVKGRDVVEARINAVRADVAADLTFALPDLDLPLWPGRCSGSGR